MEDKKETRQFKTEVQQVMSLIINSIYSNKDIFLRELISNASDALDKLKFKAETKPDILGSDTNFKIVINANSANRTIEIFDNGIGMTYDEVIDNIGTIAKSGTAGFMDALEEAKKDKSLVPELIGQFGVGFYSAFMVADKVELLTKTYDVDAVGVKWTSSGDGKFDVETVDKKSRGTQIIVHLKENKEGQEDYTNQWTIQRIIKQHSDFVNYPIVMDMEKSEPIPDNELIKDKDGKPLGETTRKVVKKETLNSMKAIWTKSPSEVSKEEHEEFYKHISHDWNPPLEKLHMRFEGSTEYDVLLYIPSKAPFDLFNKDRRHGINLYSKRVFIMEDCKELIPEYFRFIRGVVDAPDLNLNISREILQQDKLVINISKNLLKKLFNLLEKMEPDEYEKFYDEFGPVIKEGVHTDPANKEKIINLARFKTTKYEDKWVSLAEYVNNMKPDQKEIFYITGENISRLSNSPHIERLKDKGYEILLMTDPVDEWFVQSVTEYNNKLLKSAEKGDLNVEGEELDNKKEKYNELLTFMSKYLQEEIKEVKPSSRLKNSVSCLSGDTWDMSAYMEKILKSSGQKPQRNKRILELNLDHPVIGKIKSIFENNQEDPALKEYTQLLFDIATIGEGGKLKNTSQFLKSINELMNRAL